jgi:hypothetical protein
MNDLDLLGIEKYSERIASEIEMQLVGPIRKWECDFGETWVMVSMLQVDVEVVKDGFGFDTSCPLLGTLLS